jgi:phosphate transport system substrate-binding protein
MNFARTIVVDASSSAVAAEITGAGAAFPYPVYSKWSAA